MRSCLLLPCIVCFCNCGQIPKALPARPPRSCCIFCFVCLLSKRISIPLMHRSNPPKSHEEASYKYAQNAGIFQTREEEEKKQSWMGGQRDKGCVVQCRPPLQYSCELLPPLPPLATSTPSIMKSPTQHGAGEGHIECHCILAVSVPILGKQHGLWNQAPHRFLLLTMVIPELGLS